MLLVAVLSLLLWLSCCFVAVDAAVDAVVDVADAVVDVVLAYDAIVVAGAVVDVDAVSIILEWPHS